MSGGADPFAIALCVAGATALAVATLAVRAASSGGNLLMVVGLQMLVGAVILGIVSALAETHFLRPSWSLPRLSFTRSPFPA